MFTNYLSVLMKNELAYEGYSDCNVCVYLHICSKVLSFVLIIHLYIFALEQLFSQRIISLVSSLSMCEVVCVVDHWLTFLSILMVL